MLDRHILSATGKVTSIVAGFLVRRGVKADHVTWTGFAIGMLAVPLIAAGFTGFAIAAILLNRICDGLDGAIARLDQKTDLGAFLDITLDFIFYSSVPLAFAFSDPGANALSAAILIFAFVGTGSSFLAFAIITARLGIDNPTLPDKGFHYVGGLTEATETILAFIIMCLFPAFFPLIAFAFALLCIMTTISRLMAGMDTFAQESTDSRENEMP